MKITYILLFIVAGAVLVGCQPAPLAPASTRHKGISLADQKSKRGD
jgi:hypothetical protein